MSLVRVASAQVRFASGVTVILPDLVVEAGERVGVVGPNGSGKTTLLRALVALADAQPNAVTDVARDEIGYVAQRPFLFRTSVRENVALALPARGRTRTEAEAVRAALAAMDLESIADRAARSLSEGQQVRVAVARALVRRPRLLVLDEVFAALDDDGASRVATAVLALTDTAVVAAAPREQSLGRLRPERWIRIGAG